MKKVLKIIFKSILIFLGIALLIPIGIIVFLVFTHINETVESGSAYGFTIGQSKQEAYKIARGQFERGEIIKMSTSINWETSKFLYPKTVEHLTMKEVERWSNLWDKWELEQDDDGDGVGDEGSLMVVIKFHGPKVSEIRLPIYLDGTLDSLSRNHDRWLVPGLEKGFTVSVGQTYEKVFQFLKSLSESPGYESLVLTIKLTPALWQPLRFTKKEFRLVEPYDAWTLYKSDPTPGSNNIELIFKDNHLQKIRRYRLFFEGI